MPQRECSAKISKANSLYQGSFSVQVYNDRNKPIPSGSHSSEAVNSTTLRFQCCTETCGDTGNSVRDIYTLCFCRHSANTHQKGSKSHRQHLKIRVFSQATANDNLNACSLAYVQHSSVTPLTIANFFPSTF